MKRSGAFLVMICTLSIAACQQPGPRKPVTVHSGSFMKESTERNKILIAEQEQQLENWIKRDSLREYQSSENGFWYLYVNHSSSTDSLPKEGDLVYYRYSLQRLDSSWIYNSEELGPKSYLMDRQEQMEGLRLGLKLLRPGETAILLLPSHLAYGYTGDRDKIGINEPLICTLTLDSIQRPKGTE